MSNLIKITAFVTILNFISIHFKAQIALRYFEFSNKCGNNEWRDTSFIVATSNPIVIALVESELQKKSTDRSLFISGRLVMGSNGYNKNASYEFPWHIAENDWKLVELAIELCDGCPYTDISLNLDYWVNTVKRYCGWSTRVKREVFPPLTPCKSICVPVTTKIVNKQKK
jgi:hypothetical protein